MLDVAKRKRISTFDGEKLRELREAAELTQTALAEAADVHPIDISKYERGVSEPSWTAATRLAAALDVKLEVFWKKDDQDDPPRRKGKK